jgi:GT2 family glycosyltransferase
MPDVAAIVVNWNGGETLRACLESLAAQQPPLAEIVVVDNASSDGSVDLVARFAAEQSASSAVSVRVVGNTSNRGYAGGANDGIAATGTPFVLVCNPDAWPQPDYVAQALAPMLADDRIGAVQGKLLRPSSAEAPSRVIDTTGHVAYRTRIFGNRGEGSHDRGQWESPGPVFGVSGALALYRREMLDDVALPGSDCPEVFDEDLFAFFEDVDLDWRAAMRGWRAWYAPAAIAEHERGGAGPRRTGDVERLNFANRILVIVKCDTRRSIARALPGVVATTALKAAWLLLRSPGAFTRAVRTTADVYPRMRAKRAFVHGRARVPSGEVVSTWFVAFDYRAWVRVWWRRGRSYVSSSSDSSGASPGN